MLYQVCTHPIGLRDLECEEELFCLTHSESQLILVCSIEEDAKPSSLFRTVSILAAGPVWTAPSRPSATPIRSSIALGIWIQVCTPRTQARILVRLRPRARRKPSRHRMNRQGICTLTLVSIRFGEYLPLAVASSSLLPKIVGCTQYSARLRRNCDTNIVLDVPLVR